MDIPALIFSRNGEYSPTGIETLIVLPAFSFVCLSKWGMQPDWD